MSDFANSTHRKNWIFTKEQLEKQRQMKHYKFRLCVARAIVQEQIKLKGIPGNQKAVVSYFARKYLADPESHHKIAGREILTPAMEYMYLNHFIALILRSWPEIPLRVKNTAIVFLKRFYLYKAIYGYKPRIMMLTCLILAFKAEEVNCNPLSLLSQIEGADPAKVMEYELSLLEGIKFQMHVYSPFDSLEGLRLTLGLPTEILKERVEPILLKSYMTDAVLLYPPGVIAAAAIFLANKDLLKGFNLHPEQAAKIEEAAEVLKTAKETSQADYHTIGTKLKLFEKTCPEFMRYMEEAKKKRVTGGENKRKSSEGESILQTDPTAPKRLKGEEQTIANK